VDEPKILVFFEETDPISLNNTQLENWLTQVCQSENFTLQNLRIILCSDDYLIRMNQEHLGHDYYTDIITFDLGEAPHQIEGELYISIDRVKDNATKYQVSFLHELHRVFVHGTLHLIGYDDKTSSKQNIMRSKEDTYLSLLSQ
jgi:probable rRNA maturation factor